MVCCGAAAKWKREVVHDHKFDFIDVNTFYDNSLLRKLKYSVIFLLTLKSTLVYIADLWTAGILLFFNNWQTIQPKIPLEVARYIYLLCILCSFLLLGWDTLKARKIIQSRDIGLAYTSPVAYRIYVLKSYAHYCFFCQINNSKKISDDIAFFVFFTLKGWKRIMFAEMPRQVVNLFTIYAILTNNPARVIDFGEVYARADLENNPVPFLALCLMAFVCLIFLFSAFLTLVASVLYIPLLCHIRGNLKEYCCHKIDKRIGEMLRKKSRKRQAKEARREMARALQSKAAAAAGQQAAAGPTLPTLPDLVDDDAAGSEYGYPAAGSEYGFPAAAGSEYGYPGSEYGYPAAGSEYGYEYEPEYAAHANNNSSNNYPPPYLPADEYRRSPHVGPVMVSRAPSVASVQYPQALMPHHLHHHGAARPLPAHHPHPRYQGPGYYSGGPPPPPSEYDSPRIAPAPFAARYNSAHGRSGSVSSAGGSIAAGRYVQ